MRTALIDADVLRYEVASVGEKDGDIRSFDFVKQVFDDRISTIVEGSGSDNYLLFLSGDKFSTKIINRERRRSQLPELEFRSNFREALAKGKVYKGTRKQDKPFHWINLTAYILSDTGKVYVSSGCEADDLIAIEGYGNQNAIICTRDKDLRMVPGLHYGWECGKQPEFGPVEYDDLGKIELIRSKSGNKIVGGGWAFFCAQLLTGDVVDNIGGSRGTGPVGAWGILRDCSSRDAYFSAVIRNYQECYGPQWEENLREQCSLLWIIRERNADGSLKHFDLDEWLIT